MLLKVLAYNAYVPTPFYHLSIADELLQHADLPQIACDTLSGQRCAFFFGKTAPDVQTISGQPRPETHFYWLPLKDQILPWKQMLKRIPELADPAGIGPERAAFTAGYLCHLQADILWIEHIFWPYFIGPASWKKRKQEKIFIHNVLRSYLDEQILPTLPNGLGKCLGAVNPNGWLPIVDNKDLSSWRDFLAHQLSPDGATQTLEVFANRQGISTEQFTEFLSSEERLEKELFTFIPRNALVEYRGAVIANNLVLLKQYFFSTFKSKQRNIK